MKTSKLANWESMTLAEVLAIKQASNDHKSLLDVVEHNDVMLDRITVKQAIKLGKQATKLA